ncbi:MAG: hypothetical protein GY719_19175 [bacterium]|nr:hypothetical protein [bacterium]
MSESPAMLALPEPERLVVPVAAMAAAHAFAWTQSDPVGRAEAVYLGLLSAGMLAVIASLGALGRQRGAPELPATALLATAAMWIAYQGPSRGAAVSLILVIGLAASAARVLLAPGGGLRPELDPGVAVALALGLQILMRGDLLLAPLLDRRALVSLLLLPLAAGWAVSILAARFGVGRALLAGGLAAVLAPGFTVTSTLALYALAAGALIGSRPRHAVVRWAPIVSLVLLALWAPPRGILFALAGAGLAGVSGVVPPLLLVAVAGLTMLSDQTRVPIEAVRSWLGAALLVPAAALAPAGGRWLMRLGALLALSAALISRTPEAMAAGVALAALATPPAGATARLQRAWCLTLVVAVSLLAAYPWVREDPRGDLLTLLGWTNEPSAFLMLLALIPGLGLLFDRLGDTLPRWLSRPLPVACLVLLWALVRTVTPTAVLVDSYGPVVLNERTASWQHDLPAEAIGSVALDSNLTGGVALVPGTEVAVVELHGADGEVLREWPLRAGFDTAEWAASRADLTILAPAPWISTVAPGGTFFAQRFRMRFDEEDVDAAKIAIRRGGDLPAETAVVIYRLELRQ